MKNITTKQRVLDDAKIMEGFLASDGEVPTVVFIHFSKINPKIANMMNRIESGKLPVKQGFFIALTEQVITENRVNFLKYLGMVIPTLELLGVVEAPESIVLCTEAWASTDLKVTRPSKDPKAKDVFVSTGLGIDGKSFFTIKEKVMKMVKVDGKTAIDTELVPLTETSPDNMTSPILDSFFESYHDTLKKSKKEKGWKQFQTLADEDPVESFRQAIAAAITLTKLSAVSKSI